MQFWLLGGEATLNLTTSGGTAKVEFNCTLGQPSAPHSLTPSSAPFTHSPPPPPHRPRHRGPAERERNRLRAARHQAGRTETTAPVLTVPNSVTVDVSTAPVASTPLLETSVPNSSKETKIVSLL